MRGNGDGWIRRGESESGNVAGMRGEKDVVLEEIGTGRERLGRVARPIKDENGRVHFLIAGNSAEQCQIWKGSCTLGCWAGAGLHAEHAGGDGIGRGVAFEGSKACSSRTTSKT